MPAGESTNGFNVHLPLFEKHLHPENIFCPSRLQGDAAKLFGPEHAGRNTLKFRKNSLTNCLCD